MIISMIRKGSELVKASDTIQRPNECMLVKEGKTEKKWAIDAERNDAMSSTDGAEANERQGKVKSIYIDSGKIN